MATKILSIIIPTYNMEKYLRRCLDSLIVKENFEMLEVWVVNDGSKDSSSAIAHEYADKYPTVFNVIDKPNGNYGSCINAALPRCTGKYVKVLDSDDWFDTDAFEQCLDALQGIDADMVVTPYKIVYENSKRQKMDYINMPNGKVEFNEALKSKSIYTVQMHAITYKTENLKHIEYKQTEGISYTDQEWIYLPMITVNVIYHLPIVLYIYMLGREGQTMCVEQLVKNVNHTTKGIETQLNEYSSFKDTVDASKNEYLKIRLTNRIDNLYRRHLLSEYGKLDIGNIQKIDSMVKAIAPDIYNTLDDVIISQKLPYHYIRAWRRKGNVCIFVRLLYKLRYLSDNVYNSLASY